MVNFMKKRFIKICSVAFVMLFAFSFHLSAFATTYIVTEEGYKYQAISENTSELAGYIGSDPELIIPSDFAGKKLVSVSAMAFRNISEVESLDFSKAVSLIKIGNYAFEGMSQLKAVTLSESITQIGLGAFSECRQLETANVFIGSDTVSSEMFYGCENLKNVELSDSITTINPYAFANCTSLDTILLDRNITSIADTSFANDSSLVIYCYRNSYAHTYAEQNEIEYRLLDEDFLLGDVNLDGRLSISDASLIQKYMSESAVLSSVQKKLADVNLDGRISISDASKIQIILSEIE